MFIFPPLYGVLMAAEVLPDGVLEGRPEEGDLDGQHNTKNRSVCH